MLVGQQLRQKWPAPGLRLQHPGCNVTMEMSYYQKINFHKNDLKSYLLRHINTTIAHKHLILLKQEFSHIAFLHQSVQTKLGK